MERKYPDEGNLIMRQRERLHMTQLEASEHSGIQFGVYQRYEYGMHSLSNARMSTGLALCAVLDLDPYEIAFGMPRNQYLEEMKKAGK